MPSPAPTYHPDDLVAEANRDWDRLLRAQPPPIDQVITWQKQHRLATDLPLCKVLRPSFVSTAQLQADQKAAQHVYSAIRRAGDCIAAQPALRQRYLGDYWDQYAEFFELDCGHSQRCLNVRMDAYPTAAGLQFLELNTTPGGRGHADVATQLFEQLAVFQRFAQRWRVESMLAEPPRKAAVQAAYKEWGGQGRPTVLACRRPLAQTEKVAESTLQNARVSYAADGIELHLVEPHELTFAGGRLRHGDVVFDIVLRGELSELIKAGRPALEPLLAAVRAHAVCMTNPYDIYGHKALFAALTEADFDCHLTPVERQAVRDHVPWTRVVRAERTPDPLGVPIELLPWATQQRQQLVLKPCDGFGGQGVVLGWETDAATWQLALSAAASGHATHILQARVQPTQTTWPLLAAGMPDSVWIADRSPFLAAGRMGGYYTRMSTSALTNVSAGGSITPTFLLHGRRS